MSSLRDNREKIIQRLSEIDFLTSVSMGRRSGFKQALLIGNTVGQNIADGNKTIWDQDTSLVRLTSNEELFLSSTNVADVGISVLVTIVDELFEVHNAIVVLNGQNQVTTGVSGIVMQAMTVIGPTTPLGDIYAAPSTPLTGGKPTDVTKIQSKIVQGLNVTHNGFIIIPKGFSGIAMNSRGNTQSANKVASLTNNITQVGGVPVVSATYSLSVTPIEIRFLPPIAVGEFFGDLNVIFPEGTFIEMKASVESNDTDVFFGIDFLLARSDMFVIANP